MEAIIPRRGIPIFIPPIPPSPYPIEGLIAEYLFENDYTDSSGNSNNLTKVGLSTFSNTSQISEETGYYMQNSNNSSGAVASSGVFDASKDWSISLWAYCNYNSSSDMDIVSTLYSGNSTKGILIRRSGGNILFLFSNGSGTYVVNKSVAVNTLNRWAHLVYTWDSSTKALKIYANGVQIDSVNATQLGVSAVEHNLKIGCNGNGSTNRDGFRGFIDQVRIYDRVLEGIEVADLYNNGEGI